MLATAYLKSMELIPSVPANKMQHWSYSFNRPTHLVLFIRYMTTGRFRFAPKNALCNACCLRLVGGLPGSCLTPLPWLFP